ncbi:hypothetical protein SAMN06295905_1326 [Devosia lucknowensis]|uniref:Uncharacterized protein n=1 Tax=Devosia lucknowensis TaxID=1096929 RepID=A0A1Y6EU53_9HYPH|nr:hypothetical protein [Devosia lucknowensis]SMQ65826.1 hypothetical protein SAMN06295905_1326 [Devosia lucknowensis]
MNGYEWLDGQFRIVNGDRVVATTGGTLLQFLTAQQTMSATLSFPDALKGQLYTFSYGTTYAAGGNYRTNTACRTAVGARPQEWTQTIELGVAPAGADIAAVHVILNRTAAPSHTWLGQVLAPVFPMAQEIQLWGSMTLEMAPCITRGLTVDIVPNVDPSLPGKLVAIIDQTVGPAAGNFTSYGHIPPTEPSTVFDNFRGGTENVAPSGAGVPVWWSDASPYSKVESGEWSGSLAPGSPTVFARARQYGGAQAAAYIDPTNYASTYTLTAKVRFGRRS